MAGRHLARTAALLAVAVGAATTLTTAPPASASVPPGPPWGHLYPVTTAFGAAHLTGVALDPDTKSPIKVTVTLDGHAQSVVTANRYSAVVAKYHPYYGPLHGFDTHVPIPDGSHRLCAWADNVGTGHNVQLRCVTVTGVNDPVGRITSVTRSADGVAVTGWALDPDVTSAVQAQLAVDGVSGAPVPAGSVATLPTRWTAYGTHHGFSVDVPATAAAHTVCLSAVNIGAGAGAALGCATAPAVVAPSAPQQLHASATTASTVTLSWAAPASTGGSPVTGYVVTRAGAAPLTAAGTATGITVTGLTPATTYTFSVVAQNLAGASIASTVTVTTAAAAPSAPQQLHASVTASSVTLGWAAPASTGGAPVTGYVVTRAGAAPLTLAASARGATVSGLAPSTKYTLSVAAVNSAGTSVAATVTATTSAVAIPPQTTPAPVSTSHYLRNLTGVASHDVPLMRSMGANDAGYNPSGHRYLVLLDIGGQSGGGAILSATTKWLPYSAIVTALNAYVDGYASTQKPNAPLLVAISTNNDASVSSAAGAVWADDVVDPVRAHASRYASVAVAGANDIEPGFSAGPIASRAWLSGYLGATTARFVFNGSADGCPTSSGSRCNNGWTTGDLHWLSGGAAPARIVSLPQIYNTAMPWQWQVISKAGASKIQFVGPLTEWTACAQAKSCTSAPNVKAWTMLFDALASDPGTAMAAMPYGTDLRIN